MWENLLSIVLCASIVILEFEFYWSFQACFVLGLIYKMSKFAFIYNKCIILWFFTLKQLKITCKNQYLQILPQDVVFLYQNFDKVCQNCSKMYLL